MSQSSPVPPRQDPVGGPPAVLGPEFAARVKAAVHWVEAATRGGKPEPGRSPRGSAVSGMLAVTSAAIGPGTATTPASGTVTFRAWNGTSLSADSTTATAFNYHDKTIASGSLVFLAWALGDWWVIDVRSCGNLS